VTKQTGRDIKRSAFKQHFVLLNHYSLEIAHIGCDLLRIKYKLNKIALFGSVYSALEFIFRNRSLARDWLQVHVMVHGEQGSKRKIPSWRLQSHWGC
jgi:hypothetical protein